MEFVNSKLKTANKKMNKLEDRAEEVLRNQKSESNREK